jgi:hypothetical protein
VKGEEDGNTLAIHIFRQHNETHQTLFESGGGKREKGNGNIVEGVNLFKVHCAHGIITMKYPYIITV